jgi:hypothetical protein
MAENILINPFFTPAVKTVTDLTAHQYKLVRYDAGGVRFATTDVGSGPAYVLMNDPRSGQAAALNVPGNITKAIAGTAMVIGVPVTVGASATCIATSATFFALSAGNGILMVGFADNACNSGETFNLRLI